MPGDELTNRYSKFQDDLSKIETLDNLSDQDYELLIKGLDDSVAYLEQQTDFDSVVKLQQLTELRDKLINIGETIYQSGETDPSSKRKINAIIVDLKKLMFGVEVAESLGSNKTQELINDYSDFQNNLSNITTYNDLSYRNYTLLTKGVDKAIAYLEEQSDFASASKLQQLTKLRKKLLNIGKTTYPSGENDPAFKQKMNEIVADLKKLIFGLDNIDLIEAPETIDVATANPIERRINQKPEVLVFRHAQLQIVIELLENEKRNYENPTTWGEQFTQFWLGRSNVVPGSANYELLNGRIGRETRKIDQLILHLKKNGLESISGEMTLETFLSRNGDPLGKDIMNIIMKRAPGFFREGLIFRDVTNEKELVNFQKGLIDSLLSSNSFNSARLYISEVLLKNEFDKARQEIFLNTQYIEKLKLEAAREFSRSMETKRDEIKNNLKEAFPNATEEQIQESIRTAMSSDELFKQQQVYVNISVYEHVTKDAVSRIESVNSLTPDQKELFRMYKLSNSLELQEWIAKEFVVTAPTMIAAGFLAAKGVKVAGAVILRITSKSTKMISLLQKFGIGIQVVERGGTLTRALASTVENPAGLVNFNVGNNLLKAGKAIEFLSFVGAFEQTSMTLRGEEGLFFQKYGWMKKFMWSALTVGSFKFTAGFAEKTVTPWLMKKFIPSLADKALAKFFVNMIAAYPLQVVVIFAIGAMQNGVELNMNVWADNVTQEIVRACVSAGALTVVSATVGIPGAVTSRPSVYSSMSRSARENLVDTMNRHNIDPSTVETYARTIENAGKRTRFLEVLPEKIDTLQKLIEKPDVTEAELGAFLRNTTPETLVAFKLLAERGLLNQNLKLTVVLENLLDAPKGYETSLKTDCITAVFNGNLNNPKFIEEFSNRLEEPAFAGKLADHLDSVAKSFGTKFQNVANQLQELMVKNQAGELTPADGEAIRKSIETLSKNPNLPILLFISQKLQTLESTESSNTSTSTTNGISRLRNLFIVSLSAFVSTGCSPYTPGEIFDWGNWIQLWQIPGLAVSSAYWVTLVSYLGYTAIGLYQNTMGNARVAVENGVNSITPTLTSARNTIGRRNIPVLNTSHLSAIGFTSDSLRGVTDLLDSVRTSAGGREINIANLIPALEALLNALQAPYRNVRMIDHRDKTTSGREGVPTDTFYQPLTADIRSFLTDLQSTLDKLESLNNPNIGIGKRIRDFVNKETRLKNGPDKSTTERLLRDAEKRLSETIKILEKRINDAKSIRDGRIRTIQIDIDAKKAELIAERSMGSAIDQVKCKALDAEIRRLEIQKEILNGNPDIIRTEVSKIDNRIALHKELIQLTDEYTNTSDREIQKSIDNRRREIMVELGIGINFSDKKAFIEAWDRAIDPNTILLLEAEKKKIESNLEINGMEKTLDSLRNPSGVESNGNLENMENELQNKELTSEQRNILISDMIATGKARVDDFNSIETQREALYRDVNAIFTESNGVLNRFQEKIGSKILDIENYIYTGGSHGRRVLRFAGNVLPLPSRLDFSNPRMLIFKLLGLVVLGYTLIGYPVGYLQDLAEESHRITEYSEGNHKQDFLNWFKSTDFYKSNNTNDKGQMISADKVMPKFFHDFETFDDWMKNNILSTPTDDNMVLMYKDMGNAEREVFFNNSVIPWLQTQPTGTTGGARGDTRNASSTSARTTATTGETGTPSEIHVRTTTLRNIATTNPTVINDPVYQAVLTAPDNKEFFNAAESYLKNMLELNSIESRYPLIKNNADYITVKNILGGQRISLSASTPTIDNDSIVTSTNLLEKLKQIAPNLQ